MSLRTVAVVLLVLALPLSGCLEAGPGDAVTPRGDAFTRTDAEPIGFHAWSTCGLCHGSPEHPEQRLFVAFEDGRAILVHFAPLPDAPEEVAFDVGVTFDRDQLRALLLSLPPLQGQTRAGFHVGAVETARIPEATFDALRAALHESFIAPPRVDSDCVDCPGEGTYGRPDNGTWERMQVIAYSPHNPEAAAFERLNGAFREAEATFESPRVTPPGVTSPTGPTTPPTSAQPNSMDRPATPECVRFELRADPPSVEPGQGALIMASVTNVCEELIQVQGSSGCTIQGVHVFLLHNDTKWWFVNGSGAVDFIACTGILPAPVHIAPGETLTESWSWNGTLAQYDTPDHAPSYTPLAPGAYNIVAHIVRPSDMPEARSQLHVNGPPTP